MATETRSSGGRGGVGFFGLLTIVFITLKLTGHIDWTWWWVFSPLFIAMGLFFVVLLFVFILAVSTGEMK